MKILVTGAAGFVGAHCALRLSRDGHQVVGLENFNDDYDPQLKPQKPRAYVDSHLSGLLNILESCRRHPVKHLIHASSNSVYGANPHTLTRCRTTWLTRCPCTRRPGNPTN